MSEYRIYLLDHDGRIRGVRNAVNCASDQDALKLVDGIKSGVEVWTGTRLVQRAGPTVDGERKPADLEHDYTRAKAVIPREWRL